MSQRSITGTNIQVGSKADVDQISTAARFGQTLGKVGAETEETAATVAELTTQMGPSGSRDSTVPSDAPRARKINTSSSVTSPSVPAQTMVELAELNQAVSQGGQIDKGTGVNAFAMLRRRDRAGTVCGCHNQRATAYDRCRILLWRIAQVKAGDALAMSLAAEQGRGPIDLVLLLCDRFGLVNFAANNDLFGAGGQCQADDRRGSRASTTTAVPAICWGSGSG